MVQDPAGAVSWNSPEPVEAPLTGLTDFQGILALLQRGCCGQASWNLVSEQLLIGFCPRSSCWPWRTNLQSWQGCSPSKVISIALLSEATCE
jgi:hypothetical protein